MLIKPVPSNGVLLFLFKDCIFRAGQGSKFSSKYALSGVMMDY